MIIFLSQVNQFVSIAVFTDNIDISSNTELQSFEVGCTYSAFPLLPYFFRHLSGQAFTEIKIYGYASHSFPIYKSFPEQLLSVLDQELSELRFPVLRKVEWKIVHWHSPSVRKPYFSPKLPRCKARGIEILEQFSSNSDAFKM